MSGKCLWIAGLVWLAGCGGNGSSPCEGVECDRPPDSACKDSATRVNYHLPGVCVAATGECRYESVEEACDDPPGDSCMDEDTLMTFDPAGRCQDGYCSYEQIQQECPYGCSNGRCTGNPSGDFELIVPPDTRLCSTFAEGDDCARCTWEAKSRVSLREGTFLLPAGQEQFELDWVEQVEIAPQGETAVPAAAGLFSRTVEGDSVHYEYRQTWVLDSNEHELVIGVDFSQATPVLTLDTAAINLGGRFSGSVSVSYQRPSLISCDYDSLLGQERTIDISNGDQLWLSFKGWQVEHGHPFPSMTYRAEIVEARFTHSSQDRLVDEFFNLAATLNHHGPIPAYWIVLEEPLENIYYLRIDEFSYGDNLMYLDENQVEIDSQPY